MASPFDFTEVKELLESVKQQGQDQSNLQWQSLQSAVDALNSANPTSQQQQQAIIQFAHQMLAQRQGQGHNLGPKGLNGMPSSRMQQDSSVVQPTDQASMGPPEVPANQGQPKDPNSQQKL